MRLSSFLATALAAASLTACAEGNGPTSPATAGAIAAGSNTTMAMLSRSDRLATIEWVGNRPTLWIQDADGGNRTQVHFAHVSDHVLGNYTPRQLPVTDESLVAIQRIKWSPDGRQLAAIVQPAYHAAQVVVIGADGRSIRTASPNSQYMYGDVEWSPDSRRIAYIMATGPSGRAPDLFVTDLGRDLVSRITTNGMMSAYDAFRFDASGDRLLFTEHLGWGSDGVTVLSQFGSADLTSGSVTYGAQVLGQPQGFTRDGASALFIRDGMTKAGAQDLVKVSLTGGPEMVLTSGDLWNAVLLDGDQEAILVIPDFKSGALNFALVGIGAPDDLRGAIPTPKDAAWIALLQR